MLALAGCSAGVQSDWEKRQNLDEQKAAAERVAPPAYPNDASLVEFVVPEAGGFRFFVDRATLGPTGKDGVVRYVLVARSPDGASNVSYEGIRCSTGQYRIFAVGGPGRSWGGRASEWRALGARWHRALYREYFCPQSEPIRSAAEGVQALEAGGHPFAKGFGAEGGR